MDNFYGKYRAKVTENDDPDNQGRIKVKVPKLFGDNETDWCYPCVPVCGNGVGFFFLPQKDDLVWIEFEGGDSRCPIWSGGWWKKGSNPEGAAVGVDILQTTSGHKIKFINKDTKKLIIEDSSGQRIEMDETNGNMSIQNSTGRVSINGTNGKVVMTNAKDNLGGEGNIAQGGGGLGGILPGGEGGGNFGEYIPAQSINTMLTDTLSSIGTSMGTVLEDSYSDLSSALTSLIASNIGVTLGSLYSDITTLSQGTVTQITEGITTLNNDITANINTVMSPVNADFTDYFNNIMTPDIVSGAITDQKYLDLLAQGLGAGVAGDGGILADINSVVDSTTSEVAFQLNYLAALPATLISDMQAYVTMYTGTTITSVSDPVVVGLLATPSDTFSALSESTTDAKEGVSAAVIGAVPNLNICQFSTQTFEIDNNNNSISMSDSTGQSFKIDSTSREVSMNDFAGQSIKIDTSGISIQSNGLIRLF